MTNKIALPIGQFVKDLSVSVQFSSVTSTSLCTRLNNSRSRNASTIFAHTSVLDTDDRS